MTLTPDQCSACIEMLYAKERDDIAERIALAAHDGFAAIEFWGSGGKDIARIAAAAKSANIKIQGFLCDPTIGLADPANHAQFFQNIDNALAANNQLNATAIIVILGPIPADIPPATQRDNICVALKQACNLIGDASLKIALEPINQDEMPDGYLHTTSDALDIIDTVAEPHIGLLYDLYHSGKQGEDMRAILAGRVDRILHVHLADLPDRHEPGTGTMAWQENISWLRSNGYQGLIGLEYLPERSTREGFGFFDQA